MDHRALRNYRNVRCASAYVDDRRCSLVTGRHAGSKSRCQSLLHHEYFAYSGVIRCIDECTLLDLRDVGDHAHWGVDGDVGPAALRLFDEMSEHLLRPLKIAYDATRKGSMYGDIATLAARHIRRFLSECDYL